MKRFIDWLKPDSQQQSAANSAERAPVSVRLGTKSHDSTFSLSWTNQADSSIFDTGSLRIEKSEDRNSISHGTLGLEGDSLCSAEEDTGFDPYDTGRLDNGNK